MKKIYELFRTQILPLEQIHTAIPKNGVIVDLGCGEGLIATYLAKVKTRNVTGVDLNFKRLPKKKLKNLSFLNANITKFKLPQTNAVVISDVLHHLSKNDQDNLLKNIYKSLKKEGLLIIKEIDTDEFIRSKLSRFWDFVLYPKDKIHFRSSKELNRKLTKLGFKVNVSRPCRFFPGSTTLYTCRK